jgi:Tol biopolymer transport system component
VLGNSQSGSATLSDDGRYVAFESHSSNLVPGDANGVTDVFCRDRLTGMTEQVSVGPGGVPGNSLSQGASLSADGRFVAFWSLASNLVLGDTNSTSDVFVRDRVNGSTERVSVDSAGVQATDQSLFPSISADGRYVAFMSSADNLVPGDTNGADDIFVHDRLSGMTERVSVDSAGVQSNDFSDTSSISADGRFVAFSSLGSNLDPADLNNDFDAFVHDRQSGMTEQVSVDSAGLGANSFAADPAISDDGRFVLFQSSADNLVPGDTNGTMDTFLRDRQAGTTERVSIGPGGLEGNFGGGRGSISADGRYVGYPSFSSNLVPGDTNGLTDVFVRDLQAGTTTRVSVSSGGGQGNGASFEVSTLGAISSDGSVVAFTSSATNLVGGDTNASPDVFVRDELGGPSFTFLCEPGVAGVGGCPCSNPPAGPGQGCDNSAGSGGAILSASGGTIVSSDSLVLSTSGEVPHALSIVVQGSSFVPTGIVYGQGVRCVGGALKRLFTKTADGGGLIAPDFGAGDPQVSVRSAALGDTILAGQSRWYFVYYRDPVVLGGCPPISTFNATQTGQVTWSP